MTAKYRQLSKCIEVTLNLTYYRICMMSSRGHIYEWSRQQQCCRNILHQYKYFSSAIPVPNKLKCALFNFSRRIFSYLLSALAVEFEVIYL